MPFQTAFSRTVKVSRSCVEILLFCSFFREASFSSNNESLCSLSSLIKLAVNVWRLLQTSPMRHTSKFRNQKERTLLLQVCHNSSSKFLFPIVLLALSTALRKAEILGLKWKDINLEDVRITLHHTKNGDRRFGLALTKLQDLASTHKSNPRYLEEYVFTKKKVAIQLIFVVRGRQL